MTASSSLPITNDNTVESPRYSVAIREVLIAAQYVVLWTIATILIRGASDAGIYRFNLHMAIFCTESLKFTFSAAYYVFSRQVISFSDAVQQVKQHKRVLFKTLSLALIYAFYNVMTYWNLSIASPGLYRLLINVKVLFSAVGSILVFRRHISPVQWLALFLLMAGCATASYEGQVTLARYFTYVLIIVQGALSSTAGIISEHMFKTEECPFMLQNVFLYFWSAVVNLTFGYVQQVYAGESFTITQNFSLLVLAIITITAVAGFSTSLLLRYLSNLAKEFAHAVEVISTMLAAWFVFGSPITPQLIVGASLVVAALALYNRFKAK